MFSPTVFLLLLLAVWSASAGDVVFEDSSSTNNDNNNVGTRNGPFDDSVVIEAAGSPSGDVDSRFFGLGLLGGGGLLGGNRPYGGGVGGGYPGGAFGATKPGKCPGILGLGIGQPEGGYYPGGGYGGGFGHHGGYGGYPGGGIYPGGYGGYGYPGQYGHGGGFGGFGGFRSGDQGEENGEKSNEGRRKRSDEAHKESGDVQGRALPGDHNTDARFLPGITGLFGQQCYHDSQCPGQLKCCGKGLGHGATCQQPAIFG